MINRHTLVVGGTRGIGHGIVNNLAEDGHILSVIGRRPPPVEGSTASSINYWALDILDDELLEACLAEMTSQNGQLSSLIFCQRFRGDEDDWEGELETSLTATKKLVERFVSQIDENNNNSIVIISSVASYFVAEEQPLSYHVGKAGLNQMVRYYAVTLGSKKIRINSVSPGLVLKEEAKQFYRENESLHQLYRSITPLARMATPEDIGYITAFLCSPKASFITGQDIVVDGGLSLQMQHSLARQFLDG